MDHSLNLRPSFSFNAVIGATLAACVFLVLMNAYSSWKRLSHIPGPRYAQFSILWVLKHGWSGRLFPCLAEAGKEHGNLVRIGPNLLVCSDPDELRRMSSIRTEYTKGPSYDAGRINEGDTHLASERDPAKHKALKAKMGPVYSSDFQPAIDRQISNFINLIQSKYAYPGKSSDSHLSGRILHIGEKTQFYSLDCIGDLVWGKPFGFLETDEDVKQLTQLNDQSLRMVTAAGLAPWLNNLRTIWPFTLLVPREGDKLGFGILHGFARDLIEERTAPDTEPRKDFLQAFIASGMSKHQLIQQVYLHIVAGADSTSNWLRMVMLCLLTSPPAYQQLQKEIDDASKAALLKFPIATDAEARALPYLDAVLREAIRVHPPSLAPNKLSPLKPKEPGHVETVCGYEIPRGTQIGANIPAMFRSREIFGPDAECFRPERWLQDGDVDRLSYMKSTVDLVFGAGKFQCLGKNVSWMETRKLVVELMRRFDFALVNNVKPLHVESLAITVVHDFRVRVTARSHLKQ